MPGLTHTPLLVCGAHRTGTTWVGKMLAAAPGLAYISEPLNVLHRPGVLSAPTPYWYTYIGPHNEAIYLPALQRMLAFRYRPLAELLSLRSWHDAGRMARDLGIFLRGRLQGRRPLLKDPFAVVSADWFARRLGAQVVVTIRHPAGFASSLKRLNWPFDFQDLLAQPELMAAGLGPYRTQMEAMLKTPDDIMGQASLLWQVIYSRVHAMQQNHPEFIIVRHEDLSVDPVGGFRQLYQRLGLDFTPQVEQTILTSSSSENPGELAKGKTHSVRLDSRANLYNWKKRLSAEEIDRIRRLTGDMASIYYPDADWGAA